MFFIFYGVKRMIHYYHIGYYNRKITRWTSSFAIKFFTNLFISMNYFSLPISIYFLEARENNRFFDEPLIFLYFINSAEWVFFVALLYFEFRRKLAQTWNVLRGFWLVNGLQYLIKIIFIFSSLNVDGSTPLKVMVFIQACFSMILLYFAFFGSVDYEYSVEQCNNFENNDNMLIRDSEISGIMLFKDNHDSKLLIIIKENYLNKIICPYNDTVKNDIIKVSFFYLNLD